MKKSYQPKRVAIIIATMLLCTAIVVGGVIFAANFVKYPEEYSTISRTSLLNRINDGNQEAIEYYITHYIDRDVYLYNGPLTLRLCAERHSFDFDTIYNDFNDSDIESFQLYFNTVLK